ncbi:hypothetical protein Hanom_Chr06g00498471 [Helianthus anomalus]
MDNDSLKQLARYHPNHPEPSSKVEFFGFIKDKNYQDPDPVNHQNWRNVLVHAFVDFVLYRVLYRTS